MSDTDEILSKLRPFVPWMAFTVVAILMLLPVYLWWFEPTPPQSPVPSWSQVSNLFDQVEYAEALALAEQLESKAPDNYYGPLWKGHIFLAMGRLAEAEAQFARAYELFPSKANAENLEATRRRIASSE